jgi:hypothetical protein
VQSSLGSRRNTEKRSDNILDEGQELEALELALEHIDDVTQDREAINALITKILWRYLSFGSPWVAGKHNNSRLQDLRVIKHDSSFETAPHRAEDGQ